MADAPDLTAPPAKKARKAPARKATTAGTRARKSAAAGAKKTAAPKTAAATAGKRTTTAKPAAPTFAESASQARAAMTAASAAARAKMKDVADKASTEWASVNWKGQGDKVKAQSEQMYAQASKMARDAADSAKARTGTAMQSLARLISETADTVDTKLGPQYGDYTRQAASAVAGAAKSLDDKDIDQLLGEARDFVRKSPAVAIGAAAVAGYVLMRLAKGSGDQGSGEI